VPVRYSSYLALLLISSCATSQSSEIDDESWMRIRKKTLLVLLAAFLFGTVMPAHADPRETFEPGTGKYIVVLKDPRADVTDPATGKKKAKEPDVAKHGGKVLSRKNGLRVIKLPLKFAKFPGKLAQITRLISDKAINPQGKPVVVYGPNLGIHATRTLQKAGATVVRTLDELLKVAQ
jgi:hypothetical protein